MKIRSRIDVKALALLLVSTSVVLLSACGDPERSEAASASGEDPAAAQGDPDGPRAPAMDVCAFVPLTAVAQALGHDPAHGVAESTQGQWTSDCTYTFSRDGAREYAMIWVYSKDLWAPEQDTVIEELPGLGDAAYQSAAGTLSQVKVLVGDRFFDTRASTPEGARALAALAAAAQGDG